MIVIGGVTSLTFSQLSVKATFDAKPLIIAWPMLARGDNHGHPERNARRLGVRKDAATEA